MRRLITAAFLGLALGVLAPQSALPQGAGSQQITCNKLAFVGSIATGVTTQVIAGTVNQLISVCGYVASSVAASTVQFVYGTGTNCGTGTTTFTAAANIGASVPLVLQNAFAFYSTPPIPPATPPLPGNSICVTAGGTGPVNISISYAQF